MATVMAGLAGWFALQSTAVETLEIDIQVSPASLYLDSQGVWVTIHTDIDYGDVVAHTVTLNGVPIKSYKSDLRGDFVAKFDLDAVKDVVEAPETLLTLTGYTQQGAAFHGSAWVKVMETRVPNG